MPALVQLGASCPRRDTGLVGGWVCAAPHGGHHFWAWEEPLYDELPWEGWFWGGQQPSTEHWCSQGLCPRGPRSPSSWACQQSASCVQLSAMLRLPAPAAWIPASPPLPPTVCSWMHTYHCAHTHAHRLAVALPSPSPPANALASCHRYRCQSSEGRDADCPVLDLHVLSFDVF